MGNVIRQGGATATEFLLPLTAAGGPASAAAPALSLSRTLDQGVAQALEGETRQPLSEGPEARGMPGALLARLPYAQEPPTTTRSDAEIEALKQAARASGHEEGYARGEAEGREAWDRDVAKLAGLIAEIDRQWRERLDDAEDLIAEAIYAGVLRIVGEQAATREGVAQIARGVLAQVKGSKGVLTVHLSQADYDFLGQDARSLIAGNDAARQVAVVADPRVKLGGCLVESERGRLDGRLEMQLERLKEALLDARRHAPA